MSMVLSELIGEEIFEARLIEQEEESIDGNFIKYQKMTNEYEPKGISKKLIETKICNAQTGNRVQEGVEESDFELDEHGNITIEKMSIDCGVIESMRKMDIAYSTTYGPGNRVEVISKESPDKKSAIRKSYLYDSRDNICSIIFDEITEQRNTIKLVGDVRICNILRDNEGNIFSVIFIRVDHKNMVYIEAHYMFDYDITNTSMLKRIYLLQPGTMPDPNNEEYISMNDDTITAVSCTVDNEGTVLAKKTLIFKRY